MSNPVPTLAEFLTDLPTTTGADLTDIIYAVQGFSPSSQGLSVQQTLNQIQTLFRTNLVLTNTGNPNGMVAGTIFQFLWDSTNGILYLCTQAGTTLTAVWEKVIKLTGGSGITITQSGNDIQISSSASGVTWNDVTGTSATMASNNAYQANNAGLVTLTLPLTSSFGDIIKISGLGAGGWSIAQNAGQQIIVGSQNTTAGVSGSLSSTQRNDGIELYCVTANLIWKNISGSQGSLTYV